MKVKLQDILDAMEMMNQYDEYFLDKETGEIEYVSDMMMTRAEREEVFDRLDEHGFTDYRILLRFGIMTSWKNSLVECRKACGTGCIK